jgi:hypothetical protein
MVHASHVSAVQRSILNFISAQHGYMTAILRPGNAPWSTISQLSLSPWSSISQPICVLWATILGPPMHHEYRTLRPIHYIWPTTSRPTPDHCPVKISAEIRWTDGHGLLAGPGDHGQWVYWLNGLKVLRTLNDGTPLGLVYRLPFILLAGFQNMSATLGAFPAMLDNDFR